jgi:hypothetical protein
MSNSPTSVPDGIIRLDPCPSKVFSWIEFNPAAEAVLDDRGHTIQPAGPCLTVHYRYNGAEWTHWPVSREEAIAVMNPGAVYGYSIGSVFSQLIKSYKSSRMIKTGERQETKRQREEIERRAGKRWLA